MDNYSEEFSNDEITVSYSPHRCINAEICAKGLSKVFRHDVLPWIDMEASTTKKIICQIKKCPSGALTYKRNLRIHCVKNFEND